MVGFVGWVFAENIAIRVHIAVEYVSFLYQKLVTNEHLMDSIHIFKPLSALLSLWQHEKSLGNVRN